METNEDTRYSPPLAGPPAWTAIRDLIEQAPGLKYADYADADPDWRTGRRLYEATKKQISRDRARALALLEQAAGEPYNRAALEQATDRAYSGRLHWTSYGELELTPGQHPAEERRRAACAILRYYMDTIAPPARVSRKQAA